MSSVQSRWWHYKDTPDSAVKSVQCRLCFHQCEILPGKVGFCGARKHDGQGLVSPYLGQFCSVAIDPIEKKPLYYWMPKTRIFSLGSVGCTMRCLFCQNHSIAQPKMLPKLRNISIQELVSTIVHAGVPSVAFTYNEPALQGEYIFEAGPAFKDAGIAVVLVTNGMMSEETLADLLPWIDALNIDVKTFNAQTYAKLGGSLEKVQQTVSQCLNAGKHVELTTLVVPGISDDKDECAAMIDWIYTLSPDIPLHFSRYFPAHKYTEPATERSLLFALKEMALEKLSRVDVGNV